ncbi:hypothetical protein G8O24_32520 [Bradyrhizobium sp. INPA01-394B]|uniref:Uncharacterized protein n=1 Tax=Bradyrhizobium campsiandrae TaxID=1729892 RepID=A0ABR7U850_9BRAD|nr:hypothetical protein [Bradyrhizobium campsiandrae]MBC9882058.1 hypothetical protein [Bradyrhizobium campsiandrae]MBC9979681.1 hypothetical protein [Bradyrhizobium campsiandrae]
MTKADQIVVKEWSSRSEMLDRLRDKRVVVLKPSPEEANTFYNLELPPHYDDCRIIIFSTGHRAPLVTWLEPRSKLIVAFDSSVTKLDLASEKVEYSKELNGIVYEFLEVDSTGECIVLHQLGIDSISPDGDIKWSVHTGLVEDFARDGVDLIRLKIMDDRSLEVNLKTGIAVTVHQIDARPVLGP